MFSKKKSKNFFVIDFLLKVGEVPVETQASNLP